ncbi:MAG: dihydroorotate dehydrogenase [Cirrosporium novae-zelandiae]|nr:MAG: dihydroorotate dehydrogenase [Cirrosporium novae-zelandiae]
MSLNFHPPLLNSANPWCSSKEDLQALHSCPNTGAVTVRTSLYGKGFPQDEKIHQFCFFDGKTGAFHDQRGPELSSSSLNTLGYSPVPLHEYLDIIAAISKEAGDSPVKQKPWVISVTGSVEDVVHSYDMICEKQITLQIPLLMEVNLSCPNISGKPPPAYDGSVLEDYLQTLKKGILKRWSSNHHRINVGIKTPPYTYQGQFDALISALRKSTEAVDGIPTPTSFITATNTLGGCLVLDISTQEPALGSETGTGIGGMAGTSLHPLALGNVRTIRSMLDKDPELKGIQIIGVGGVDDAAGYRRMRCVGANAVAVGTALGRMGLKVFQNISGEVNQSW